MNVKSEIFVRMCAMFRITEPQSWARVSAANILAVPNVGDKALNKLRLYLAHRGISLRGDNPPSYWIETIGQPKKDQEVATCGTCPFTIVIDTNETYPFSFDAMYDNQGVLISIPIVRRPLYLSGLADYTISGMEHDIQIERKADDLFSSMSERREIFEGELCRLNDMCEFAAVVVEMPWREILSDNHNHGARAKSTSRTVQSWMIRYPGVHWVFAEGRYMAEQVTFRLFERFWWSKTTSQTVDMLTDISKSVFSEV